MSSVHFYEFDLASHLLEDALPFLSADDRLRLATYHPGAPRRRFGVGRGLLRSCLGQWLKSDPQKLPIRIGPFGKPELEGLFFNLSHASEKMILIVSEKGPVGVDIEKQDVTKPFEEVEDAFLSPQEKLFFANIDIFQRKRYLPSLWTIKEAYLKEKGCGFMADLRLIDTHNLPHSHLTPLPVPFPYIAHLVTSYEVSHVINSRLCNPFTPAVQS